MACHLTVTLECPFGLVYCWNTDTCRLDHRTRGAIEQSCCFTRQWHLIHVSCSLIIVLRNIIDGQTSQGTRLLTSVQPFTVGFPAHSMIPVLVNGLFHARLRLTWPFK